MPGELGASRNWVQVTIGAGCRTASGLNLPDQKLYRCFWSVDPASSAVMRGGTVYKVTDEAVSSRLQSRESVKRVSQAREFSVFA